MAPRIEIDADLVRDRIDRLAAIGRVGETGVTRTLYDDAWVAATDQYAAWCDAAGLAVTRDAVGNVWGRLEGTAGGDAVVSGSHIDSQVNGGRFDGALGALAGLIAVAALRDQFGAPKRPLEAVAFCEEEGSRFPNAQFWGSRAITGRIGAADLDTVCDGAGRSIGAVMRDVGLDPDAVGTAKRGDIGDFIELHIEQGPILEQDDLAVAIVDAITGIRHYHVTLTGVQNHAGGFPMDIRNDPMAGFLELGAGLIDTAHRAGRPAVSTIGRVEATPGARAIIPREVRFTLDTRHPDPAARARQYAVQEALMREVAARRGLGIDWTIELDHPPCLSDPGILAALQAGATEQGIATRVMASGAGHDTQQMARIARVAMIFVRSKDGRSHTPEEFSSLEDCVEGIRLLAAAMHKLAY
ncbi:MAG: M20 family metallo-hydrolase [Pseudomonadota bacterium]|nr:M20 family metallo-hydrolase [Pseudomonadota bacterium]